MFHEGEIIDVSAAARLLGLHEETLRRMARDGRVPAFKVGRGWRFNRTTLHEWAEAQRKPPSKRSVLIVDDEELDLELIGVAVEAEGFTVVTANSGAKALDIMRQELPDIVLLDLKMPGMDGPTVLCEIRKAYGSIPVILITGYPDSDLVAEALGCGPVTLLAKPVGPHELNSAMQMVLNGRTPSVQGEE